MSEKKKETTDEELAFTFIKGDKLDLVPGTKKWAKHYARWTNDPEVRQYARNMIPHSIEEVEKWNEPRDREGAPKGIFMTIFHKEDKKPVGVVGLGDINWFNRWANAFIQIDKNYWGKGVATEATKLLLQYAFEEVNLNKVSGKVIIDNVGSWKVAEKVGFTYEGILKDEFYVHGEYKDVKRYAFLRKDWLEMKGKKKSEE